MPKPDPKTELTAPSEAVPGKAAGTKDAKSQVSLSIPIEALQNLLRMRKNLRGPALILALLLLLVSFVLLWYCWFVLIPQLWHWWFLSPYWRIVPAVLALFFLLSLPAYAPVLAGQGVMLILDLYNKEAETKLSDAVDQASEAQKEAEQYLQEQLGDKGSSGLVPLTRYSRVQLESYYKIGLNQTQRSFRHSVIAMWIGFFIIVLGIMTQTIPFEHLGLPPLNTDVMFFTLAGGAIVEVISALFLWVYRSSIVQLTYFYNRQIYNHGILMAYLIAQTMEKSDDTKKLIIEKMLSQDWMVTRPDTPGSAGIQNLIAKAKA